MTLRLTLVALIAAGIAEVPAAAQSDPVSLELRGDPALQLDLGATRPVPLPRRATPDGPIVAAPFSCWQCIRDGVQEVGHTKRMPRTLIGQSPTTAMSWFKVLDPAGPTVIWTERWTLVSFLAAGKEAERTPEEVVRLRAVFPKLSPRASQLDGHQRAHLWAGRLARLESAISDALDLDDHGCLKAKGGATPLPHQGFELHLFTVSATEAAIRTHLFPQQSATMIGRDLGSGPVATLLMDDAPPDALRRRFLHGASVQMLASLRRLPGGPPPWMHMGLAHFFERLSIFGASPSKKDLARTFPRGMEPPADWDQAMRDLVASGRAAEMGALSATTERGLMLENRLQGFSLVKFLMGVDPQRFAALVTRLYQLPPDADPSTAMDHTLQEVFGHGAGEVDKAWKAWVASRGGR
jgi:hypothetical protein